MLASSPSTQGESDFSAQGKPSDSIRSDFALGMATRGMMFGLGRHDDGITACLFRSSTNCAIHVATEAASAAGGAR